MAEIIGIKIIKLDEIDSTNNYTSKLLANSNVIEGTVVVAKAQSSGRGQLSNQWESEYGKNILASFVFYPKFLPVQQQFLLSKVIALGVRDLLTLFVDKVKVKWPNDIYIGNKKVAGILIENSIMGHTLESSIAGVGININQTVFLSDAPNPVSLIYSLKKELDCSELLLVLCECIDKWYSLLSQGNVKMINENYHDSLYQRGIVSTYRDKNGEYEGMIEGVNAIGQLQIKPLSAPLKTYHFKEVEFL
ncbi:MAG TPA: biotin--[acetyl-CoA-carboxylase] ligase [Prolixibacteraceae bacterium]|nr:biotin--[acetyl-CoA-carboxylase] ligase [Prolixibacteraceae bacterium]